MAEAREGARASKVPREVFTVTRRLAHEYIPYIHDETGNRFIQEGRIPEVSTLTRNFRPWRVSALLRVTLVAVLSAPLLVMLGGSAAQATSPAVFYGNNAGFGQDRLEKFDKATGALLQTYTPSGGNGRGVVVVGNIIYSTVVGDPNIYKTDATTGAPLGTIPTTVASMSTLAWDGSHFWTTDYSGPNRGFELDVAGNVIKTITFPLATGFMDGMEYFTAATSALPIGGKLIVNRTDGGYGGPIIYDIYDLNGNVLTPAFITSTNGTGIGYDGKNFFVSDIRDNLVNVFDGMTGAFISSLHLGGPSHVIEDVSFDYSQTLTQISTSLSGGGQSGPTITVPAGTAVTDASTLSGVDASTATGTVTYSVYDDPQCQNKVRDGGTKTVTNGVVPDSAALTFNSGGPFYWQASYSGDVTHNSSTTACGDEVETLTTAEQPISAAGVAVAATEGAAFSGTVATFTDPDTSATAADYTASINWGDTTTSVGTVSGGAGSFTVSGGHTYAEQGTFTVTTTITDADNTANQATVTSTATVADAPVTAGALTLSGGAEGSTPTTASFLFSDANTAALATEYTATINWGDTSTSAGTVSGGAGSFTVTGSHQYAEEGTYKVTVTATGDGTDSATATGNAIVADAPLTSACAMAAFTTQIYSGPTATFSDASTTGTLSDFSATINWGDSSTSAGTIAGGPGTAPYTVSGSHTYTSTGYFTVTTKVTDVGGSTTTATCTKQVLVFAFAPGGGSFAIGDKENTVGASVNFWGAQWAKNNPVSSGTTVAAFKGFAEKPATPTCGTTWSADPGNSTPPPAGPLPAYMGVIVTSRYSQSGSLISGNTVHIVIVKTDPGYDPGIYPNPGHPGTGKVVATVC